MIFTPDFFEAEVREDFEIDSAMKHCWAAQLEMLNWLLAICEAYHLRIFADYGTLLGAVRHKGFIPWDDDIDMCMPREDYDKFIKILPRHLGHGFFYCNRFCGTYMIPFARVCNSEKIEFSPGFLQKFHGFPFVSGIDIFPLDNVADNPEEESVRREIMTILSGLMSMIYFGCEDVDAVVAQVEELTGFTYDRSRDLTEQSFEMYTTLATLYNNEKTENVGTVSYNVGKPVFFPRKAYDETVYLDFENMKIPAPAGYDDVLRARYGDYRKVVRFTSSHDYPSYARQAKIAEEQGIDWRAIMEQYA